jgi:serine/threonine-protein kinase RsbW
MTGPCVTYDNPDLAAPRARAESHSTMTIPSSPDAGEQRTYPARLAAIADAAAFAQDFCRRHGVGLRETSRLTLIIEELFTNTVRHGYRGDCDQPIRIALGTEAGAVTLFYEDAAPRYDPLARINAMPASVAAPFESRAPGGLGVVLVGMLAASARYGYEDERNRLWLKLRSAA